MAVAPLLVTFAGSAPAVPQVPVGPQFQVNTYDYGYQTRPAVTLDQAGGFVVAWRSDSLNWPEPGERSVRARRFASDGTPTGADFIVAGVGAGSVDGVSVAGGSDGRFVVVWSSFLQYDQAGFEVLGRRFDGAGNPVAPEFAVNRYSTDHQLATRVAVLPGGDFVVVWESRELLYAVQGVSIHGRRYASNGSPLSGEFRLDQAATDTAQAPAVGGGGGGLVAVWQSESSSGDDSSASSVQVRRFSSSGIPAADEVQVNIYTTADQGRSVVAVGGGGDFVVVWESSGSADDDSDLGSIQARRFGSDGSPLAAEFQVNEYTSGRQESAAVGMNSAGDFIVVWRSVAISPLDHGIRARRFASDGTPLSSEFRVESYTTNGRFSPTVVTTDNQFMVVWASNWGPGSDMHGSIQARLFSPTADLVFADDFESGDVSAWSAVAGAGSLTVTPAAALVGSLGLDVELSHGGPVPASRYVEDDSPERLWRYRARFYLDPNGYSPGSDGQRLKILQLLAVGGERLATMVLRRQAGAYRLLAKAHLDDGSWRDTGFVTISDAPHAVEIDWRRAISNGAGDGSLELFVDGASVSFIDFLDNDLGKVDIVRLGALGLKPGATGSFYVDAFESRRHEFIGLLQ